MPLLRPIARAVQRAVQAQQRTYSTPSTPPTSPFAPRHLLSIADLSISELNTLVRNASSHKQAIKSGSIPKNLLGALAGKTVAMTFSKRSTRTRVSSEGAIVTMGGHPMFLGKEDIQLGVNESLYDTSVVISSMVSAIIARVGPHADVADLAKHSSVPVINALSDAFHPLQTIADFLTIHEVFPATHSAGRSMTPGLGLEGLKVAWVGDANNVLYDLAIGAAKLGVDVAVATPEGYQIHNTMREIIKQAGADARVAGKLTETTVPEEAVRNADILVTDTWVSMGQEEEKAKRLKAFEGFQITHELAQRGGAKPGWKFMHCLPRHQEEVSDEVFYSPRSLVFTEAENRLWAAISALEAFVVNKGKIPAYSRHSRRSHPNLQHLSLLPLTPHHPLSTPQPTPSYLAAQSLPTTPSILSRSPSRTRPNPRSTPALHSLDRSTPALHSLTRSPLPTRSKSSTSLPHTARASHPRPRLPRTASSSSWLAQTAHLLTATTRASKGQTWLATRSSSTSLTAAEEYDPLAGFGLDAEYNGAEADDEYSPTSYRTPFTASRAQSRFASARNSRRGSGVRGMGGEEEGMGGLEPDFVDGGEWGDEEEEEEEVDEGEVRRLIGGRVGGWVDWLVGWMDFRGDDLVEGEDEEGEEGAGEGEEEKEREREEGLSRRKRRESERVVVREGEMGEGAVEKPPEEGEGGWKDAAWLLSVATKIIT